MCNSNPKMTASPNSDSAQAYKTAKEKGLGINTLPKTTDPNYKNEVGRRRLSYRAIRSGLRINTSNLSSGSGLQI